MHTKSFCHSLSFLPYFSSSLSLSFFLSVSLLFSSLSLFILHSHSSRPNLLILYSLDTVTTASVALFDWRWLTCNEEKIEEAEMKKVKKRERAGEKESTGEEKVRADGHRSPVTCMSKRTKGKYVSLTDWVNWHSMTHTDSTDWSLDVNSIAFQDKWTLRGVYLNFMSVLQTVIHCYTTRITCHNHWSSLYTLIRCLDQLLSHYVNHHTRGHA